ncbi:phage baseplate assembly protein V [Yersinia ruckeri]|uniref:phage baseplate assembly protein V n=1 Tax=Yersinia ruckeri TaxID=29486 RepID=UPI00053714D2|nr:phage baseplate assembly protein V [Yersinia ruckeri]AKA37694.1 prophage baseplate assembly protein V [Yersinia ruckeri]AUQ42583.1 phage baseplate assembly protein V [Yersinia ruckeri]EKN4197632.1 phage baseplate assembly protein [Yersinia ruckeri]EKN4203884.1 phage baseplate assembly protein [Yersinia ruckeri]EKN4687669.1 phage baseplate assembly protein [Yersinia ruckeri]
MSRLFAGIQRGLSNMLVRAVVRRLDSSSKNQMLQIQMIADESKDNIEHLEPYGFTSAAHMGAEAFAAFPDGDRSHGVVLVVADRRYRIKGLESGEVAIYSDEGDSIILKRGNQIELNTRQFIVNAEEKTVFNTPLIEASGQIKAHGNVESAADVQDKIGTMAAMRDQFNSHTHPHGEPNTAAPNQKME